MICVPGCVPGCVHVCEGERVSEGEPDGEKEIVREWMCVRERMCEEATALNFYDSGLTTKGKSESYFFFPIGF